MGAAEKIMQHCARIDHQIETGCDHQRRDGNDQHGANSQAGRVTGGGRPRPALKPRAFSSRRKPGRAAQVGGRENEDKKARRGGYIAAGFLSLFDERTFPPRNAFEPLKRLNAAFLECVRLTTFYRSSQ